MGEIISILNIKKKNEEKTKDLEENADKENVSFEQIAEINRLKEERLKKEREKANRSVLRSYRLKT
jgi:hypothetical protein